MIRKHYQIHIDEDFFLTLPPIMQGELMGLPIDPDGGFWDRLVTPARLQTVDERTMRFLTNSHG